MADFESPEFRPLPTEPATRPPVAEFAAGAAPVPAAPSFTTPDPSYTTQEYPPPAYYPAAQPPPAYGGYGGYGMQPQPVYPVFVAQPKTNGMAIASLVVSVVGAVFLVCYGVGGLLGSIGAILGHVARKQIRERQEAGDGMAKAGVIVGWIATGIAVLAVIVIVGLIIWAAGRSESTAQALLGR